MTRANPADTLSWPLEWTVVSPDGPDIPVVVDMGYSASDPLAVTIAFPTDPPVKWMCARALLDQGTRRRVGDGDVWVQPADQHPGAVLIGLSSPSGFALFRTGAAALAAFIDATFAAVPADAVAELVAMALDAELDGLLGPG